MRVPTRNAAHSPRHHVKCKSRFLRCCVLHPVTGNVPTPADRLGRIQCGGSSGPVVCLPLHSQPSPTLLRTTRRDQPPPPPSNADTIYPHGGVGHHLRYDATVAGRPLCRRSLAATDDVPPPLPPRRCRAMAFM